MKSLLRRTLCEWERTCLWTSVALLSLTVVFLFSCLAREKAPSQVRLPAPRTPASYLNEKSAFDFLRPDQRPGTSARNPFAFSCRVPLPKTVAKPETLPVPVEETTTAAVEPGPVTPGADAVLAAEHGALRAAPPVPKRTASILYRGLYSGGHGAARQLAFVSTREAPGEVTGTAVLAPGDRAAGVTVKQITPAALVVAGPTGVEVSIAIGTQAQIALE